MQELDPNQPPIRLTQTVKKGGCAAKLPANDLRRVLQGFSDSPPAELIVGMGDMDDAALWDMGNGTCQIHTTDFFTPIVDDPEDFGAIAAANALSDIYAMGGTPQTALCILGFPLDQLPLELIRPLMNGANRIIKESGGCLAGGHSIDNPALIFGFAVTGTVEKTKAWTNAGAQVGDLLILTKGLGTGTITSGLKSGEAKEEWVKAAVASMTQLNKTRDLLEGIDIHAATDVTGFSLAGHSMQMAQASKKTFEIDVMKLPEIPGALESLQKGILNKAHRTNEMYVKDKVIYNNCSKEHYWLTLDPQTSGGLLLSVPEHQAPKTLEQLHTRFPLAAIIGRVIEKQVNPILFQG